MDPVRREKEREESVASVGIGDDNLVVVGEEDIDSDSTTDTFEDSDDSETSSSSDPEQGTYHITPGYNLSDKSSSDHHHSSVRIPKSEKYHIESLPPALAVGTGISYLSIKPCPIRTWVGTEPHSDAELITGVADTGGPDPHSSNTLSFHRYEIRPNPLNPRFHGIGEGETSTKGFVVLPVWLPTLLL